MTAEHTHPPSEVVHFASSAHYARLTADPCYTPVVSHARTHHIFRTAFATSQTVPGILAFVKKPASPSEDVEYNLLVATGADVAGRPAVLHGGVVATLLDEAMGVQIAWRYPKAAGAVLQLNVSYVKPTPSETTLLFRSWVRRAEGRRLWVDGEVVTEEGVVTARADGVFIVVKPTEAKI